MEDIKFIIPIIVGIFIGLLILELYKFINRKCTDKSIKILRDYASSLDEIKINPGKCRYNNRCHLNSVNDAYEMKVYRVALVLTMMDKGFPIVHMVNIDKEGRYVDNTLGIWSTYNRKYYFVKYIEKNDLFNVGSILGDYKKELETMIPYLIRRFSDIDI